MEKIDFKINLEEKDAVEFAKLHFYKTQKWFYYFFIAFTVVFAFIGINKILAGASDYTTYLLMLIGPVMYAVFYTSMMRTAKNNYNSREIGRIVMEYSFNDGGIYQKSDDYINDINWGEIFKVIESKTLIAIYVSKVQAMTIPKDKISPETLDLLKNLIRKSVDAKKNNLK